MHTEVEHICALLQGDQINECSCSLRARRSGRVLTHRSPLLWHLRPGPGRPALVSEPTGDWYDGDDDGHEWQLRYAIFFCPGDRTVDGAVGYEIYTDDGRGNGDQIGFESNLIDAIETCESGRLQ